MQTTHVCRLCGEEKPVAKFHQQDGKIRRNACMSCLGKRDRAKLKLDMLDHFGRVCSCCGETNPFFLTLDHVKNDGASHRRESDFNEQQMYRIARREGYPKDKWQCLCMNCNFAKGHFGICPHAQGVDSDAAYEKLQMLARNYEHDYSIVTDKQREALKLGPGSPVTKILGYDVNEILRRLKEAKDATPVT